MPRLRDAIELEWRISLSLAEKALVHAMNHHMFLCYGLLKAKTEVPRDV